MARTNATAVALVINSYNSNTSLDSFIEAATAMIDDHCLESEYTDAKLELIERWLAAHFYHIVDPQVASNTAKGVGESYDSMVGFGLKLTKQGQMAMRLDSAGNLAAADKAAADGTTGVVEMFWMGTE